MSQASQHFRSSEKQATCDGCFAASLCARSFPFTPAFSGQSQLQAIDFVPFHTRSSDTTEHTTLTRDPIRPFDHETTAEEIKTHIIIRRPFDHDTAVEE